MTPFEWGFLIGLVAGMIATVTLLYVLGGLLDV
jgi:hypothetical protein